MNDLSSLEWISSAPAPRNGGQGGRAQPKGNYYPTLNPTPPLSGRSTPSIIAQKPLSNVPSGNKSAISASDSFANLVSFNTAQPTNGASLQERQRIVQEQKAKEKAERRIQFDTHFGNTLSTSLPKVSSSLTPQRAAFPPTYSATQEYGGQKLSQIINKPFTAIPDSRHSSASRTPVEDETDILAAFDSSAPVDKSSHMPAVGSTYGQTSTTGSGLETDLKQFGNGHVSDPLDDDDDPFGLGTRVPPKTTGEMPPKFAEESDDVLGLLSRPVSEFPKQDGPKEIPLERPQQSNEGSLDRIIAELVDMGFTPEKSKLALEKTESGTNVQAAVGWLLNQAHEDSRKDKDNHTRTRKDSSSGQKKASTRRKSSGSGASRPVWMKDQGRSGSDPRRQESKQAAKVDKDSAQMAHEIGNNIFKTANSLWKTGAKKLNQAVAELNSDSDTSQPKWLREASRESPIRRADPEKDERVVNGRRKSRDEESVRRTPSASHPKVTDEALLLESGAARPQRHTSRPKVEQPEVRRANASDLPPKQARSRAQSPPKPRFLQQEDARSLRSRISRQAVEEEAAQAYISPARRKRPAANPTPTPLVEESDLPFNPSISSMPLAQPKTTPVPSKPTRPTISTPIPTRPSPPKRVIPPISPSAAQKAESSRQAGNAAFKVGDFAQAAIHYSTAISALPLLHPLALPTLTNRALSHLKTGDPKACLGDAKTALDFIGSSRGVGEVIDLGGNEGVKPMDTYWGKAMVRQAEAYEQLEKWSDAASSWRSCVEAGVGGATSIAGRNRCEIAARPKPAAVAKKPVPRPVPRPSALNDLTPNTGHSAEAVTRLRAANAAADKLDDEKFMLADLVDARILKWRTGKEANLRALLSSLENVLWENSGWKKVGMGEILMPGKVKIVYMKGIAKVHPDKLPTTATTEQKMVSAAVFATLNEAWEKFKQENGL